jgi:hypothetical protein
MVMNGVSAATKASKDLSKKVQVRGTSDWTGGEDDKVEAVVTDSLSVFRGEALPFLFSLGERPDADVVVHVAVLSKTHLAGMADINGLTVLRSSTTQEAHDMAVCAHTLSAQVCFIIYMESNFWLDEQTDWFSKTEPDTCTRVLY